MPYAQYHWLVSPKVRVQHTCWKTLVEEITQLTIKFHWWKFSLYAINAHEFVRNMKDTKRCL